MSRRGMALLLVLWLIAALSAVTAATLAVAQVGAGASRNRIVLLRAEWAREACAEILLARYAQSNSIAAVDTVDLGGRAWCRAAIEDAGERLDLNRATPEALRVLIGDDSLTQALVGWRRANGPLADLEQLRLVPGFDSSAVARLRPFATVRGPGRIDVNRAPPEVLATLPGLSPAGVAAILSRRETHRPIAGPDDLASLLPASARLALMARYQEFVAASAYAPDRVVVRIEGGIGADRPLSAERLTVVPLPGRLAVVRREVE